MNEEMKVCPLCAEDIPVGMTVCSYCGARFHVSRKGYCRSCHNLRDADDNGFCNVCGEALQDSHLESRLINQEKIGLSSPPLQPKPIEAGAYTLQVLPIKGECLLSIQRFSCRCVDHCVDFWRRNFIVCFNYERIRFFRSKLTYVHLFGNYFTFSPHDLVLIFFHF